MNRARRLACRAAWGLGAVLFVAAATALLRARLTRLTFNHSQKPHLE